MSATPGEGTRERDNDTIPPQALAVLLVAAVVDLNFLGAPRAIVAAAGHDAWLSLPLCLPAFLLSVWILFLLIERHPRMTLVEISRDVLGPFLGVPVVLLYGLFWLLSAAFLIQLQSHLFTRALLPNTPPFVLSAYVIVLALYLARHGLEPMARLFLLLVAVLILTLVPLVLLTVGRSDPGRLLPVLEGGWRPVLQGAWVTYGAGHGVEFLLMVGPLLATYRGGLKASLAGAALVNVLGTIVVLLLVMRFGARDVANHSWPTLSLVAVVELPGFTGFRLDPLFLSLWCVFVFAAVTFRLYLAAVAAQRLLRLTRIQGPVLASAAVLAGLCAVDVNPLDLLDWTGPLIRWITPVFTLFIPLLLLAVGAARGLGRSSTPPGSGEPPGPGNEEGTPHDP